MFRPLIFAVVAACLFYAALPVAGAFRARARWRTFRRRLMAASGFPLLSLRESLRGPDGERGNFQHRGFVDAIQGNDCVWIRGECVTAAASLTNARIYLLPAARSPDADGVYDLEAADETLKLTPWKHLSGLEEGTRIYAAGRLRLEGGLPVLFGTSSDPLVVLMYDGRDEDLLSRAIWAGRHRNEYWNPLTLASLAAGFLSIGTALYELLRPPLLSLPVALTAALAFVPMLPLLPPGLVFLAVYRRQWDKARRLRARRDLIKYGLSPQNPPASFPRAPRASVEECVRGARRSELAAGLTFAAALIVNFAFMVYIVRRTIL